MQPSTVGIPVTTPDYSCGLFFHCSLFDSVLYPPVRVVAVGECFKAGGALYGDSDSRFVYARTRVYVARCFPDPARLVDDGVFCLGSVVVG